MFDDYTKNVFIEDIPYILNIFDTAGMPCYAHFRPLSYPKTDIVLICLNVVNPDSLTNIKDIVRYEKWLTTFIIKNVLLFWKWIPEVKHFCKNVPYIIVGMQIDLRDDLETLDNLRKHRQRPITTEEGHALAKEMNARKYIECSALTQVKYDFMFL